MGASEEFEAEAQELHCWRQGWLYPAVSVLLGVAWWGAFLLDPFMHELLSIRGLFGDQAWTFAKVVGIVTAASLLFRLARRRWPRWGWVSALACRWLGAAYLSATLMPEDPAGNAVVHLLVSPAIFFVFASQVAVPMTALTAWVLSALDRAQRRTALDGLIGR